MSAAGELLLRLRTNGVDLAVSDGGLRVIAPRGRFTELLRAEISVHKAELADVLKAEAELLRVLTWVEELYRTEQQAAHVGNTAWSQELQDKRLEVFGGPLSDAAGRLKEMAGDCWPELLEAGRSRTAIPASTPSRELAGAAR